MARLAGYGRMSGSVDRAAGLRHCRCRRVTVSSAAEGRTGCWVSAGWSGRQFVKNDGDVRMAPRVRAGDFDNMRIMTINTSKCGMGASNGRRLVTLIADGIFAQTRLTLTR